MKLLDRFLQHWRAHKARRWIPPRSRVLDIGCHQGEFLNSISDRIGPSFGLDPLALPQIGPKITLLAQSFQPPTSFADQSFDVVVMLAVLEHIRDKHPLAEECARLLTQGGRIVITVPSKIVDVLVDVLVRLRLADGMSLEEHHGYDPRQTAEVFHAHGFELEHHRRFQLGCNHLFVLRRTDNPSLTRHPSDSRSQNPI